MHESCRSSLWGSIPPLAMGFPTSLQPPPLHFFPSPRPTWVPPCPRITWPPGAHLALNEANNTQLYAKRYFATTVAVLGTCPPPFPLLSTPAAHPCGWLPAGRSGHRSWASAGSVASVAPWQGPVVMPSVPVRR